jgi:hypothetical protein
MGEDGRREGREKGKTGQAHVWARTNPPFVPPSGTCSFWMSWDDFTTHYMMLSVCRVFKTVREGGSWHSYAARGELTADGADGLFNPTPEELAKSPQFLLCVAKPTNLFMSVTQEETGGRKGPRQSLMFRVYDNAGKQVLDVSYKSNAKMVGDAKIGHLAFLELTLNPGAYTVVLAPLSKPKSNVGYTFSVFADNPLGQQSDNVLRRPEG